jgi:hypothetical protein
VLPNAPEELVAELAWRCIDLSLIDKWPFWKHCDFVVIQSQGVQGLSSGLVIWRLSRTRVVPWSCLLEAFFLFADEDMSVIMNSNENWFCWSCRPYHLEDLTAWWLTQSSCRHCWTPVDLVDLINVLHNGVEGDKTVLAALVHDYSIVSNCNGLFQIQLGDVLVWLFVHCFVYKQTRWPHLQPLAHHLWKVTSYKFVGLQVHSTVWDYNGYPNSTT